MRWLAWTLAAALLAATLLACEGGGPAAESGEADAGEQVDPLPADAGAEPPDAGEPDTGPADPWLGNPSCARGAFRAFRGILHAHTSYSDGKQTPADAFAHARDTAKLDLLVVTDHLEQVALGTRWKDCRDQANAADAPGAFVAACGFEWGSGYVLPFTSTGHNNVFWAEELFPITMTKFKDFYEKLAACPACVGQFNHPGDDGAQSWNDFEHDPAADPKLQLFEFNGDGPVWDLFFTALDRGWRIAPQLNQDNHDADWGTKNDGRSGFWMAELNRNELREAMLALRAFMTRDRDASIRALADGVCWMGSALTGGKPARIVVEARDEGPVDGFDRVELYGPAKTLLGTHPCAGASACTVAFDVSSAVAPTYFVARAIESDGDELVAAPIWLQP